MRLSAFPPNSPSSQGPPRGGAVCSHPQLAMALASLGVGFSSEACQEQPVFMSTTHGMLSGPQCCPISVSSSPSPVGSRPFLPAEHVHRARGSAHSEAELPVFSLSIPNREIFLDFLLRLLHAIHQQILSLTFPTAPESNRFTPHVAATLVRPPSPPPCSILTGPPASTPAPNNLCPSRVDRGIDHIDTLK